MKGLEKTPLHFNCLTETEDDGNRNKKASDACI